MARILQLETSTEVCSVSLAEKGTVTCSHETDIPNSHAARLAVLIEECMASSGWTFSSLDAVAVSSGPGSYTSLRIGAATAKGICYSTDIPLIALDSLLVLAAGVPVDEVHEGDVILPMLDARRMEVYACVLDASHSLILPGAPVVLDENSFSDIAAPDTIFHICGNGAEKFAAQSVISRIRMHHKKSSSLFMSGLAERAYRKASFTEIQSFSPAYFKGPHITVSKKKFF